jgi:hypothetical protein
MTLTISLSLLYHALCCYCCSIVKGFFGLYAKGSSIPYWTSSASIQRNAAIAENTNVYSPNRAYDLTLQDDGNLVIYIVTAVERKTADAIWSIGIDPVHRKERSPTSTGPYSLIMQVHIE